MKSKIEKFFAEYKLQKFNSNHVLIRPGDDSAGIFYLINGHVRVYDISSQGDKIVVNVFQPPALFSMSWAFNRSSNEYFYETITEVSMRNAPVEKVLEFVKNNPDVMFDLLQRVFLGTEFLLRRMAHAMGGTAHTRIIYELLIEARRFGVKQINGSLLVTLHVYELAARTGLTRETASRELAKLRSFGIKNTRQGIIIKKLSILEEELGNGL